MIVNKKIIGIHSFSVSNLGEEIFFENYDIKNKKGLEGVLFGIHPDFQKMGYGTKFLNFEKNFFNGYFDYIHGGSFSRLNNIYFWNKNREIIKEIFNKEGELQSVITFIKI